LASRDDRSSKSTLITSPDDDEPGVDASAMVFNSPNELVSAAAVPSAGALLTGVAGNEPCSATSFNAGLPVAMM
jgi:hypothetical protein